MSQVTALPNPTNLIKRLVKMTTKEVNLNQMKTVSTIPLYD